MNKVMMGATWIACAMTWTGCTISDDFLVATTERVDSNSTTVLRKLEAEHEELLPLYVKAVAAFEDDIARTKELASASLTRGDLSGAYGNLVALYDLTHPCGEDDCGTHPCEVCLNSERTKLSMPTLNSYEILLEREDIDDERAFIQESSDKLYALVGTYIEERRYDEVNVILKDYNPRVPLPSVNQARFLERQRNVKKTWLDVLVKDADEVEKKRPGAATLYVAKAAQLAAQIDDPSKDALEKRAADLRARVVEERGYTIAIGSISGPASKEIREGLTGKDYPGEIRVVRGSGRVELSIGTNAPRHARSKGSTTDSFRYVSGTRDVVSSRWKSQFEECDSARGWLSHSEGFCTGGTTTGCDDIPRRQANVDEECGALDGIQKMVPEDVHSDYRYPVTLHRLDTALDIGLVLEHADRRKRITVPRVTDRLTDREHAAHEAGIPGKVSRVSADGASPPSESRGYSSAKRVAISQGRDAVMKSFEGYRSKLAKSSSDGGVGETDALATYIILNSDEVPDAVHARVKASSGVTNALELLQALD